MHFAQTSDDAFVLSELGVLMRQWNRIFWLTAASVTIIAAQSDPPGRVGRLNYLSGPVSFQPAGVDEWVDASVNRPLTTGDRIWTDFDARAEMHIGSDALRLNSRTAFEFLNLDDSNVQIRLTEGSLNIRLRRLDESETFEIDTPNLAFSLLRIGEYRVDVNPDTQETVITVRGGQGEVTGGGQPFTVRPREQARVTGTDNVTYDVVGAPPPDAWDEFCYARDRREDQSQSARYVSRDMVGWQDLDDYGDWRTVPDYGSVWVPRTVVSGWAPYHYGHWAWIEPWGWTWVDDAPWGFAPFHYGRWTYVGGYWAWVPGPIAVRPVYAPALVAWVGGPRFSVALSFGGGVGVGWFPLGPREVYVPAYRASPTYITRVNNSNTVINNINVTNVYNNTYINNTRYINREVPGAVTAVPQGALASARPVQQVAVPVRGESMQSAQVMNTAPVAPSRQAVIGRPETAGFGRAAQPPPAVINRQVVSRTTPPPPPVPFGRRQQELARDPGRPLDASAVQRLRAQEPAPAPAVVRPVNPAQGGFGRRQADIPQSPAPAAVPARQYPPVREAQPMQQQQPRQAEQYNPPQRPIRPPERVQEQPPQQSQQPQPQQPRVLQPRDQQPRIPQEREQPRRQVEPSRPPQRDAAPGRTPEKDRPSEKEKRDEERRKQ